MKSVNSILDVVAGWVSVGLSTVVVKYKGRMLSQNEEKYDIDYFFTWAEDESKSGLPDTMSGDWDGVHRIIGQFIHSSALKEVGRVPGHCGCQGTVRFDLNQLEVEFDHYDVLYEKRQRKVSDLVRNDDELTGLLLQFESSLEDFEISFRTWFDMYGEGGIELPSGTSYPGISEIVFSKDNISILGRLLSRSKELIVKEYEPITIVSVDEDNYWLHIESTRDNNYTPTVWFVYGLMKYIHHSFAVPLFEEDSV